MAIFFAAAVPSLNMGSSEWKSHVGSEVELRGFVLRSEKDVWVLSKEPNVRKCCVGEGPKLEDQVVLEGEFPESWQNRVKALKGKLVFEEGRHLLKKS